MRIVIFALSTAVAGVVLLQLGVFEQMQHFLNTSALEGEASDAYVMTSTSSPAPDISPLQVEEAVEPEVETFEDTEALVFYADNEEVFKIQAFAPEVALDDHYDLLPPSAVDTFNQDLLSGVETAAVPAAATAALLSHPKLMMVQAPGPLSPQNNGKGMRAMVRGSQGRISHQATLKALSSVTIIGAAAAVGSIAFASANGGNAGAQLQTFEHKLDGIQYDLDQQRLSQIQAIEQSIEHAREAVQQGDFNDARRHELERFETKLNALALQTRAQVFKTLKTPLDRDSFGSKNSYQSALEKYKMVQLDVALHNHVVELRTRNWYVRALYPEQNLIKERELEALADFVNEDDLTASRIQGVSQKDREALQAFWTRKSTQEERNRNVRRQATIAGQELTRGQARARDGIEELRQLSYLKNGAAKVIIELNEQGYAVAMYQERPQD